jgi:hypothetical protein
LFETGGPIATARCRARAWDRAHPRLKAEPQVHPFLAEIDTILLGRTEAKREPEPERELTIAEEVDRILAGGTTKPR